jgi:phosphoadenosine phosphosulfate reductase
MLLAYDASMIHGSAKNIQGHSLNLPSLKKKTPEERFRWAIETFPGQVILTTSFGAQSAALLHLVSQIQPDLPIVFIDTGYHFPETLDFAATLKKKLNLKLSTYQPLMSPKEIEARHGRLWENGQDGLEKFHEIIRVEPLRRALQKLNPKVWVAGLRKSSSESRQKLEVISENESRFKLLPILDWTDRDIGDYLKKHSLPYHPLWEKGYVSIGDRVTTKRLDEVSDPSQLRHVGLKRECGIHERV